MSTAKKKTNSLVCRRHAETVSHPVKLKEGERKGGERQHLLINVASSSFLSFLLWFPLPPFPLTSFSAQIIRKIVIMLIKSGILQGKYPYPLPPSQPVQLCCATFKAKLFFLIVSAASLGKLLMGHFTLQL